MAREIDISENRALCDVEQRHCRGGTHFQNVMWFHGTHVKVISFSLQEKSGLFRADFHETRCHSTKNHTNQIAYLESTDVN
jgi:hypothetical protein